MLRSAINLLPIVTVNGNNVKTSLRIGNSVIFQSEDFPSLFTLKLREIMKFY